MRIDNVVAIMQANAAECTALAEEYQAAARGDVISTTETMFLRYAAKSYGEARAWRQAIQLLHDNEQRIEQGDNGFTVNTPTTDSEEGELSTAQSAQIASLAQSWGVKL